MMEPRIGMELPCQCCLPSWKATVTLEMIETHMPVDPEGPRRTECSGIRASAPHAIRRSVQIQRSREPHFRAQVFGLFFCTT